MSTAAQVTWAPPPGALFTQSETARDIQYGVSVQVVDATMLPVPVRRYEAHITPEQAVLRVRAEDSGVTVWAGTLSGLFPIRYIDYRLGDQIKRALNWEALPPVAEELIAFKPDTLTSRLYTLHVIAHLIDGNTEEADYLMTITHDWSGGRDRLVAEVDARR